MKDTIQITLSTLAGAEKNVSNQQSSDLVKGKYPYPILQAKRIH